MYDPIIVEKGCFSCECQQKWYRFCVKCGHKETMHLHDGKWVHSSVGKITKKDIDSILQGRDSY